MVLPFYDPVWIQSNVGDPNTVLEAIPALWHIDRLTHDVSVSDIIDGEDGTITVEESEHFQDSISVSFSQSPLTNVQVSGTVAWTQTANGAVDITRELVQAFQDAGSPLPFPYVASLTGDGLQSSWPKPGSNLPGTGGGWFIDMPTAAFDASSIFSPRAVVVTYSAPSNVADPVSTVPGVGDVINPLVMWSAVYPVGMYLVNFTAGYGASRARSEVIQFTLKADVQEVFTEQVSSGQSSTNMISLSSNAIDQQIDLDGSMPIGDPGRPSYFKTDRGQLSFQYLMLLARAQLLERARCCTITVKTKFEKIALANLSCRKNAVINNRHLPGGTANGKIVGYTMNVDNGGQYGTLTIACTIGNGGSVSASAGTPEYVEDDYVEDGYQERDGAVLDVVAGELTYEDFSDFIIDDDEIDFQNMNPQTVIDSIVVDNGLTAQIAAINAGRDATPPDPSSFLSAAPTMVTIRLRPVTGGAFQTVFSPVISDLKVPKTLDLAAVSV
jgi:hypothetical protein